VSIDRRGKIWVTCQLQHLALRIDPRGGTDALGAVDLVVTLGSGAGPMNYGDMTRSIDVENVVPEGTWSVIHDGGRDAIAWNAISWHADEPAGTRLAVAARAGEPPISAARPDRHHERRRPGGSGLQGRFIEMRAVSLARGRRGREPGSLRAHGERHRHVAPACVRRKPASKRSGRPIIVWSKSRSWAFRIRTATR
jgi:hypothetical protein